MSKVNSNRSVIDIFRNFYPHLGYAMLISGIAVHIYLAYTYNFTQDDAFITFRYAANYVNGDGLVFNIGERVEGYTNFLWTIIMIIARNLGINLIYFSRYLGVSCGVATVFLTFLFGLRLFNRDVLKAGSAALLLGATYSFAYWSVAGLETAAFALATLAALYTYHTKSPIAAPLAVIASLLRPEGVIVFGFIVGYEILRKKSLSRYALIMTGIYVLTLVPYLFFKYNYYGGLLPNTFYAKSGSLVRNIPNGLEYIWIYIRHYLGAGVFIIPALIYLKNKSVKISYLLIFILLYTIYIILVGGDVLKVHRFFIPLMSIIALVIVYGIFSISRKKHFALIGLAVVLGWQLIVPKNNVNDFLSAERFLIRKMVRMAHRINSVDKSNFTVAVSTIGVFSYNMMGHTIIDLLGLTDSTIARHPEPAVKGMSSTWKERNFNTPYILTRQPRYILFSTGHKPSAPAERALYMYSQFLKNYRTIGFFFDGVLHDVFVKAYPITGDIVRDIPVDYVDSYNKGINLKNRGEYKSAMMHFEKCDRMVAASVFPYVKQYKATVWRDLGKVGPWINNVREVLMADTLCYLAFRDMYFYQRTIAKDEEKARFFRAELMKLVPWYVPRLDSLIESTQKQ